MVRTSVGKIMWKKHQSHLSGGTITFSPLHTVKTGIASSDELGNQLLTNSPADKKYIKMFTALWETSRLQFYIDTSSYKGETYNSE